MMAFTINAIWYRKIRIAYGIQKIEATYVKDPLLSFHKHYA
jgi:hypothetical protein